MTAIDRIAQIVQGHEVFIQGHNFPDADSLASAYGMKHLLELKGVASDIIYVGKIERLTISRMMEILEIHIALDEEEPRLSADDQIIIVDAQKHNSNIKDCVGEEVVCIDHHPFAGEAEYRFSDIRPDVGACSSIIAGYFGEAGLVPDRKAATALLYGIYMDTLGLKRGTSNFDVEMFAFLYPLADHGLLDRLYSNTMRFEELVAFGDAIKNIQVYDNVAIVRLDTQCSDGLIAEIGEFMLNLLEIELCVVYAIRENGVKLSLRSELPHIKAGGAMAEALAGIGSGGGHAEMAGGFIHRLDIPPRLDEVIRARFLDVFKKGGFKGVSKRIS
ncbi:MAG: DHH family phosphoesterase [Lachnospiraceae bacterium]|jgi:nanoRNase/pAp phosphatase (c-di-AMP/oligoRNAs hydrolase)|nr:DHH family phosphoesterase [Lachnospiraceae bacterium]